MVPLILSFALGCAIAMTFTTAAARSRQQDPPAMPSYPYDPNAVFVADTYAGSDPDSNIRAALAREFGTRED